ncbi:MAG: DNA topoisomerase I [Candidatus Bathyarchaeia archaeon]
MRGVFIICEKRDAAKRLAEALSDGRSIGEVSRYGHRAFEVLRGNERITICHALGHLYEVGPARGQRGLGYPILDFSWRPKSGAEGGRRGSKGLISAISELCRGAGEFVNACDYDLEGELIGYMILKYACGGAEGKAKRMKFSTLTPWELRRAYDNPLPSLNFELVEAARCRHEVDWVYGINLSRALINSVRSASGRYEALSIGRVQGPTLKFVVERELEIATFIPRPYWSIVSKVEINGAVLNAEYEGGAVSRKDEADGIVGAVSGKRGVVERVEAEVSELHPPTPFSLPDLQAEAYKHFALTPKRSLAILARLYLNALISYPRTSSQKLPKGIDYASIIESLSKLREYEAPCSRLLAMGELRPNEGYKDDPAHPAIYPTGNHPTGALDKRSRALFDLIVKRFLATFGKPALRRLERATLACGGHKFRVSGVKYLSRGWIELYSPYADLGESPLPPIREGQEVLFGEVEAILRFTKPKPRFNPSSLLRAMEDEGIGTKATRADIIDILFRRGYMSGNRIEATPLGMKVVEMLSKYCPRILDAKFTKELEASMEAIARGEAGREEVLATAIGFLKPILSDLRSKEGEIGEELSKAIFEARSRLSRLSAPCPRCGSPLSILRSKRTGKRFIGCSGAWAKGCKFALPLPRRGKLSPLNKVCEDCGFQLIQVRPMGRGPFVICPKCFAEGRGSGP